MARAHVQVWGKRVTLAPVGLARIFVNGSQVRAFPPLVSWRRGGAAS
jgi:hypothetical protein